MKHLKFMVAALSAAAAIGMATTADAAAKKVCYAFQDLSTGFWVAGHEAIVDTLNKSGVEVVELNGGTTPTASSSRSRTASRRAATASSSPPMTATPGPSSRGAGSRRADRDLQPAAVGHDQGHHRRRRQRSRRACRGRRDGRTRRRRNSKATGKKLKPLILMGDLADPNAVQAPRRLHELGRRSTRTCSRRRSRSPPSGTRRSRWPASRRR